MIFAPIPLLGPLFLALSVPPAAPRIRCVEARTASVFAGACHYGAETTTAGREALIAWHVESGVHAGVDLAGVDAAAAIAGEAHLADREGARRSILYVSDRASPEQRLAAEDLLRVRLAPQLGRVVEVRCVPLAVEIAGDDYRVDGGRFFRVEGALLADRACCRMPAAVWYEPLAPIGAPIVGFNAVFRYADDALGVAWVRRDENTTLAGGLTERE